MNKIKWVIFEIIWLPFYLLGLVGGFLKFISDWVHVLLNEL